MVPAVSSCFFVFVCQYTYFKLIQVFFCILEANLFAFRGKERVGETSVLHNKELERVLLLDSDSLIFFSLKFCCVL
jgi:hypothetical protein